MNTLEKIQSLINVANEITGKADENLTKAVESLIDGYSKPIILNSYQYTPEETKNLFGLQNTIRYYNGTDYSEKIYSIQQTIYNVNKIDLIPGFIPVPFIGYTGGGLNPTIDNDHMTAQFQIDATINNCYGIQACFAALARGSKTENPPFTKSIWHLQINGENIDIPFRTTQASDEQTVVQERYHIDGNYYAFCTVNLDFNSMRSVHFGNIDMYGNFSDNVFTVCLAAPIIKVPINEVI